MLILWCNLLVLVALPLLGFCALARTGRLPLWADITLQVVGIILWVLVVAATLLSGNLVFLGILITLGVAFAVHDNSRKDALLWTLAIATERGMPLAPAAAAFAEECRGPYRRRVRRFAELLAGGTPLDQAAAQVSDILPEAGVLAARMGTAAGVLAPALREAADRRTFRTPLWYTFGMRLLYLLGVLTCTQGVMCFFLIYIAPKLRRIFDDIGVELSGGARWLLEWSDWCVEYWFLPTEMVVLQAGVILYLTLVLLGWAPWHPPLVRRLTWRVDAAAILRLLALVVEAGQPLPAALHSLAELYPLRAMRRRLKRVEHDVAAGQPWWESLRQRGIIRPAEAAALAAAHRAGNLTWAMRELADSGERRLGYHLQAWSQVLFPIAVLAAALPVAAIAATLVLPIIEIMRAAE